LGTVIPIAMFHLDPERLLASLYRSGATYTDPAIVAQHLGVGPGRWIEDAKRAIAAADTALT